MIYASEDPLLIFTIKPTLGANAMRNDCDKSTNPRIAKNFKPIATRHTSAKYALVKIVNEIIAGIHGLTSFSKNLDIPKPNKNNNVSNGTD